MGGGGRLLRQGERVVVLLQGDGHRIIHTGLKVEDAKTEVEGVGFGT